MTLAPTPSSAAPTDDPVRAALRHPQTLERLRVEARVLLRRVRPGLSQTLLAQLADEVVSRTVEIALKANFDSARGTSVSAWLAGITRNVVRKELCGRPSRVAQPAAVDWDTFLPDTAPSPDEQAVTRDEAERVRAVLDRLPPHDRQILEMCYFDGLTATEIGKRLNALPATVRVWLHRARKATEQLLTLSRGEGAL